MSRVADRMIEVSRQLDLMAGFNSQIFEEIKLLYGKESEEFKMIQEIDSKIDDLMEHLNSEE